MFLPIGEGNLTLAISLKILKDLLYRSKARVPAGLVSYYVRSAGLSLRCWTIWVNRFVEVDFLIRLRYRDRLLISSI
jgi:hypothetical protein